MNTTLSFSSKATKRLTPTTAKVHLCIQTQGKKEDEVLQELKDKLAKTSTFVKGLVSYKPDSYTQTKFNTRKDTIQKKNYTEKIMGYRSWVNLYFSLNYGTNGEDAILDMVSVINMSLEEDITCNYEFIIDNDVIKQAYDELYVEAVNNGWDETLRLTSQIKPFEGKTLNLVSIDQFRANLESPNRQEYAPPLSIESDVQLDALMSEAKGRCFSSLLSKRASDTCMYDGAEQPKPEKVTKELIGKMFNNPSNAVVTVSLQFCMS